MQNKTSSLLKGIGVGMIAGAAVTVTAKTVFTDSKHNITKGSAKLIKAAGEIADGIQTMFR